jgi:cobalt-zinc-cadmium efflux system membrane fusion protein
MPYPYAAAAPPRATTLLLSAWLLAVVSAGASAGPTASAATSATLLDAIASSTEADHGAASPSQVQLTPEQRRTLGLATESLAARPIGDGLRAPGEVRLNAYATAQVTPRITAQVIARHARLGDRVVPGQPLVTLSSVELAEA